MAFSASKRGQSHDGWLQNFQAMVAEMDDAVASSSMKTESSSSHQHLHEHASREPTWILVFPMCSHKRGGSCGTCCVPNKDKIKNLKGILQKIFVDLQMFEQEDKHSASNPGSAQSMGYINTSQIDEEDNEYYGSRSQLDVCSTSRDVVMTKDMIVSYQRACGAESMLELRAAIIELLLHYFSSSSCSLNVRAFSSRDGSELFLAISASERILLAHADAMDYKLQLSAQVTGGLLSDIKDTSDFDARLDAPYIPYDVQDDFKFRSLHHHSPFNQYIGKETGLSPISLFRSIDRIRIIRDVIELLFNMEGLESCGIISAVYCCHDIHMQEELAQSWISLRQVFSTTLPLDKIRDYLGENISFRLAISQLVTKTLIPMGLVAPLVRFAPLSVSSIAKVVFSIMLFAWTQLFSNMWKQVEAQLCLRWGMDGFGEVEQVRPQFQGNWETSPIDGYKKVKVTSVYQELLRKAVANIISCAALLLMLATIGAMLYAKIKYDVHPLLFAFGNTAQVQFFRYTWSSIAYRLTHFENHRTRTEFRTAYTTRMFSFMMISTMSSLFYIAYFKHFVEGCGDSTRTFGHFAECGQELTLSLSILFVVDIASEVAFSLPCMVNRKFLSSYLYGLWHPIGYDRAHDANGAREASIPVFHVGEGAPGYIEMQRHMPEWGFHHQAIQRSRNYVDLACVMFFSAAVPELIILYIMCNLIRIRIMGRRLVHVMQRSFPMGASGLGPWNNVFRCVIAVATMCNVFFAILHSALGPSEDDYFLGLKNLIGNPSGTVPRGQDWKTMLAVSFVLEHVALLIMLTVHVAISEDSPMTALHRSRRECAAWIYRKLISGTFERGEIQHLHHGTHPEKLHTVGHPDSPDFWRCVSVKSFVDVFSKQADSSDACSEHQIAWSPISHKDRLFEAASGGGPASMRNCCL